MRHLFRLFIYFLDQIFEIDDFLHFLKLRLKVAPESADELNFGLKALNLIYEQHQRHSIDQASLRHAAAHSCRFHDRAVLEVSTLFVVVQGALYSFYRDGLLLDLPELVAELFFFPESANHADPTDRLLAVLVDRLLDSPDQSGALLVSFVSDSSLISCSIAHVSHQSQKVGHRLPS